MHSKSHISALLRNPLLLGSSNLHFCLSFWQISLILTQTVSLIRCSVRIRCLSSLAIRRLRIRLMLWRPSSPIFARIFALLYLYRRISSSIKLPFKRFSSRFDRSWAVTLPLFPRKISPQWRTPGRTKPSLLCCGIRADKFSCGRDD